MAAGREQFL